MPTECKFTFRGTFQPLAKVKLTRISIHACIIKNGAQFKCKWKELIMRTDQMHTYFGTRTKRETHRQIFTISIQAWLKWMDQLNRNKTATATTTTSYTYPKGL